MSRETAKLLTPETLRECYINRSMTQRQIAQCFNVSEMTVQQALTYHSIRIRKPTPRKQVDPVQEHLKEQFIECYVNQGMSVTSVAKQFNVTYSQVHRVLRAHLGKLGRRTYESYTTQSKVKYLYSTYKRGALERKHSFDLTLEQFEDITQQDCYYCGIAPSQNHWGYTYNGIDRIDNSKGYVPGNVRPSCGNCNMAKRDRTEEEFYEWLQRIAAYKIWERKEVNCL